MCALAFAPERIELTPIQRALYDSLFTDSQTGWQLLQQTFLPVFTQFCQSEDLPMPQPGAQGFFDYCTRGLPDALALIYNSRDALEKIGAPASLPERLRPLLRQLFSVGIERWVHQAASSVAQRPPELGASIALSLADPWVVYLITLAKLKLKGSLPASPAIAPVSLIMVNAPLEGFGDDELLKPVADAVQSAYTGQDVALPLPGRDVLRRTGKSLERRWGSTPVIGVCRQQGSQLMRTPEAQRMALAVFGMHTVEFGADPTCEQALKEFENGLRMVLQNINQLLYPIPPQEERMNPATPPQTNPPAAIERIVGLQSLFPSLPGGGA